MGTAKAAPGCRMIPNSPSIELGRRNLLISKRIFLASRQAFVSRISEGSGPGIDINFFSIPIGWLIFLEKVGDFCYEFYSDQMF